jgi:hypothetical protein
MSCCGVAPYQMAAEGNLLMPLAVYMDVHPSVECCLRRKAHPSAE